MNRATKILLTICYWVIQLTWGALMTIPGLIITAFVIVFLKGKPHRNGFSYIVEVGGNWGGIELGAVALCGRYNTIESDCFSPVWYEHTRRHEFGHTLQNLIFGPLQLFVVGIPSMIRYQVIMAKERKGQKVPEYDDVWFEGTATRWGTIVIDKLECK